jgi:hypothetical protein
MSHATLLLRYRLVLSAFIAGLALSGITAFPLLHELELLASLLGLPVNATPASLRGLQFWIATVRDGLRATNAAYPWLALFFIGPWRDPVPNAWVLKVGLAACAGVLALALTCGAIRGIPIYWRLVDCSFGVFGAVPLLYCLRLTRCLTSS